MQALIRDANRRRVLCSFLARRTATRGEIAQDVGLSLPTVAAAVQQLRVEGFVKPAGEGKSRGGRRPEGFEFVPDARVAVGFDLEPGGCTAILVDLDMRVIGRWNASFSATPRLSRIRLNLRRGVEALLRRSGYPRKRLLGVGVAVPGIIDPRVGVLRLAPNMGLRDVGLDAFVKGLGLESWFENEANAAALAETDAVGDPLGLPGPGRTLVYLSITAGVGAGVIVDGWLVRGWGGRAGEIGHLCLVPGGRLCGCGRRGCLERYVSRPALLEAASARVGRNVKSPEEIGSLLAAGHPGVAAAWEEWLDHLAQGLSHLATLLDPDEIVLGGEIGGLATPAVDGLRNRFDGWELRIRGSRLEAEAPVLGAALLPVRNLYFGSESRPVNRFPIIA